MRLRVLAGGVLLSSFLFASPSAAGPAEDRAAADALFTEARTLMRQGKYAEACPKIEAANKLDPTPGTLLTLGDCYERNGRTAGAWATFHEAEALARRVNDGPRAAEAARRAGLLEPNLSKLLLEVPPESRVAGLEVRRNGRPVDEGVLGTAIPVEPGPQTIEASAPRKQGWSIKIDVEAKPGVLTVRVPLLADVAKEPPAEVPKPEEAKPARSWQRPLGIAVMAAGGAGLVVGAVLGGVALSTKGESNDGHCFANNLCDQEGIELRESAIRLGNISTGALIAGGVLAVGGVVLFATAPSGEGQRQAAPQTGWSATFKLGPGGFQAQGVW